MRLLLVEDDKLLAEGLVAALERMHYSVEHCIKGSQAIAVLTSSQFDIVILDLGLPDGLALPVIRALRDKKNTTPILVLTAWDHLETKVEALNAGADDYVLKPCDVREIEARLRVLLRRYQQRCQDVLRCQDVVMDLQRNTCRYRDQLLALTAREFLILKEFMLHQHKILSRQYLEELSAGFAGEVESNSIEVHIHNIRKKTAPGLIKTVRGAGYMLVDDDEN